MNFYHIIGNVSQSHKIAVFSVSQDKIAWGLFWLERQDYIQLIIFFLKNNVWACPTTVILCRTEKEETGEPMGFSPFSHLANTDADQKQLRHQTGEN